MTALSDWIGREETAQDPLSPGHARLMQATLDMAPTLDTGDDLPPLWHWIYFPTEVATSALGPDGHPARGGFLPPVSLPRRMWAGGRLAFHRPLILGRAATRRSVIEAVRETVGRAGPLCFVTVRHEFRQGDQAAVVEHHEIVYRAAPRPGAPPPQAPMAPNPAGAAVETIVPTMPLLLRYSALTFNAHRIHYDQDYCREVEGYPGCVVHGPLVAMLLYTQAARTAGRPASGFAFTARAPLFHDAPFQILSRPTKAGAAAWATTPGGHLAMEATATL